MRKHTRTNIWTVVGAILLGLMVALGQSMCERAWGQAKDSTATTLPYVTKKDDQSPTLSEVEKLKLVNTYQAAVIAQVDKQAADARATRTREAYVKLTDQLREAHKWDSSTQFEINSETGEVTVHLPPTKTDTKPTNPPHEGTKEQHK